MLAAGIKSPAPLEELESHLREEIERQLKTGISGQQAFESAVLQIGRAEVLKNEFIRAKGLRGLSGDNQTTRIHRVLGMTWLGLFSWGSLGMLGRFFSLSQHIEEFSLHVGYFLVNFLLGCIYLFGMSESISLIRGKDQGRRVIRFMAFLCVGLTVVSTAKFRSISISINIFAIFLLATIWLRRPLQKSKLVTR